MILIFVEFFFSVSYLCFFKGKSLDKVAELREKGKLHKPTKRRKSKHKMRSGDASGDVSGGVPSSSKKVSPLVVRHCSYVSEYVLLRRKL